MQKGLSKAFETFAKKNGINSIEKLQKFYHPTERQREMIKRGTKPKGSFEKGWAQAFMSDKFGEATTHWRKLEDRVHRGVGNPCPLLLIGIPIDVVVF